MEDLGALIFFVDPLSAHPHQADIDSLIRLSNCGNVIVCPNPTSAMSMMHTLKCALEKGSRARVSQIFLTQSHLHTIFLTLLKISHKIQNVLDADPILL